MWPKVSGLSFEFLRCSSSIPTRLCRKPERTAMLVISGRSPDLLLHRNGFYMDLRGEFRSPKGCTPTSNEEHRRLRKVVRGLGGFGSRASVDGDL